MEGQQERSCRSPGVMWVVAFFAPGQGKGECAIVMVAYVVVT